MAVRKMNAKLTPLVSNGNYALGNERFAIEIAAALGRRSVPGKSGRPRWMRELETGESFNE